MLHRLATYRLKDEGSLPIVLEAIARFAEAVRKNEPGTVAYESFQDEDDPQTFFHVMAFRDEAAEALHQETPHVEKFVAALYPECEEEPTFIGLMPVRGAKGKR